MDHKKSNGIVCITDQFNKLICKSYLKNWSKNKLNGYNDPKNLYPASNLGKGIY